MGAMKRIALLVFAVATVLGVGYLAILWFAWPPVMPAATWLASQAWFFVVEAVLLGIVLVGTVGFLVWAIAAPGTSSRLRIEQNDGEIDISRDAIVSTARKAVEAHRGLTAKDVRMKIVGKHDPKLRLRIKVDPGRHGMLEPLGSTLADEVTASVTSLTGYPIDKLRISFTQSDAANAAKGTVVHPVYDDEIDAGSEGASFNIPATMTR